MKAIITGASSGLGSEFARQLSKMGYDLILTARRTDRLNVLKSELKTNVTVITADLTSREDCERIFSEAKNADLLINNAGYGYCGFFADSTLENDLAMLDVNITALHYLTKKFLKVFLEKNSGAILNVASVAGFMPGPLMAEYYATKAYVLHLTEAIYRELKLMKSNVKISVLCPGPVDTEFNKVANVSFALKGMNPSDVVRYAIKKMQSGKPVIIPGATIKLAAHFSGLVPRRLLIAATAHVQKSKIYQ